MTDPITFAVIKAGLDTIVDDMAYAVMRTARSPIVRDVLDYSVTLCDARGRILAQAKTVALHLGAVPDAMEVVLERFAGRPAPGDVIVLNDPYAGGMHLPDIFMFKPIFTGERLLGFAVVIAHHCDMGGRVPGSNASRFDRDLPGGPAHPADEALRRAACRTRRCWRSSRRTCACPTWCSATSTRSTPPARIGERELLRLLRALRRRARSLFRPAARLWRGADPQGDRRMAGRRLPLHRLYRRRRLLARRRSRSLRDHGGRRPLYGRLRRLLAAGERRDQLDLQLRQVGDLSRHPLRARPGGAEQRRRLSLHHGDARRRARSSTRGCRRRWRRGR